MGFYDDACLSIETMPLAACSKEDASRFDDGAPVLREEFPPTAFALAFKSLAYHEYEHLCFGLRNHFIEVRVFSRMVDFSEAVHALCAVHENGELVK